MHVSYYPKHYRNITGKVEEGFSGGGHGHVAPRFTNHGINENDVKPLSASLRANVCYKSSCASGINQTPQTLYIHKMLYVYETMKYNHSRVNGEMY